MAVEIRHAFSFFSFSPEDALRLLSASVLRHSSFLVRSSSMTTCRRSFCTSLQMSPESGSESSRPRRRPLPASAIAAGKYFGSFQLEEKIEDLVVIRTVRPHPAVMEGVSATRRFSILLHHPLSDSSCPPLFLPSRRYPRMPEGVLPLHS